LVYSGRVIDAAQPLLRRRPEGEYSADREGANATIGRYSDKKELPQVCAAP
jgi:hypothetical protein